MRHFCWLASRLARIHDGFQADLDPGRLTLHEQQELRTFLMREICFQERYLAHLLSPSPPVTEPITRAEWVATVQLELKLCRYLAQMLEQYE